MSPDWQGAWQALTHHPLFGIGITLGAYQLAMAAYERTRWVFLQPVLVSMLTVIGILLLCGLSFAEYRSSVAPLTLLLGPATVALAVPLYLNLRRIRQLFWPIILTLLIAGTFATVLGAGLAWLFGAERPMLMSMAPKSVTSPIAMLVADQIGGIRDDHRGHRRYRRAIHSAFVPGASPGGAGDGAGHHRACRGHGAGAAGE